MLEVVVQHMTLGMLRTLKESESLNRMPPGIPQKCDA